ncbi:MAG: chromosome segregation protein SMC [Acutalibacteraceae bacterium]|jgi:chromosome segregation protein
MILKALEIHGFKSFPDKTVLRFGRGMTAVVGPNGSGKSNISDAIRWVLGEQSTKSLRGSSMEDVIFSGTAKRKGVGFAEVSLVFDNAARQLDFDADDVKVTRRYYRSGKSEYIINQAAVRLKDVQMLFMDTGLGRDGYSIIGQGRIGDIVSSKSADRREIFEEAAGIAKYRYRKNEAERRLASAEENLLRLRDIVQELESRVGPLKQQAEKARQFLELAGEKKELEIGLWLHTLQNSRQALRDLGAKLELALTQYEQAGAAMADTDRQIEEAGREAQRLAAEMDELRRSQREQEEQAGRLDAQAAVLENDQEHNKENIARIEGDIARSQTGDEQLRQEQENCRQAIADLEKTIAEQERRQLELTEQMEALSRDSDQRSGEMEALSRDASAIALRISDARVEQVTAESSLKEIDERLAQLAGGADERQKQAASLRDELTACEEDLTETTQRIESLQNELRGYEMRLQSRLSKRDEAKQKADQLALDVQEKHRRARILEDLERNMEGFGHSVKMVMQQAERGMLRGIRSPVSRLIDAPAKYALAIETALGAAAQNVVCDREDDAKRAIRYLQENRGGRATFLPLNTIKGRTLSEDGLEDELGFVGLASDLCTFDKAYAEIVNNLLGRTVVAEDLDYAVSMARKFGYRFRVVTLDGQVVNAGGSMTGGSTVKSGGMLSRRNEIAALKDEEKALQKKADEALEQFKALQQETAAVQAQVSGAQGELTTAQEDKIRCEGEHRRLQEQLQAADAAEDAVRRETEGLGARAEENRRVIERSRQTVEGLTDQQRELEQKMNALSGGRQQLAQRREELAGTLSDVKLAVLGYRKEQEAHQRTIDDLAARQQDAAGYREGLARQIRELEQIAAARQEQIAAVRQQAAQQRRQMTDADATLAELATRRAKEEERQSTLIRQSRDKSDEREMAGQEVARMEEKVAAAQREEEEITRKLYEEYELTRAEAERIAKPIENLTEATRRLNELRGKIRRLGSVNVDAIEEYKEVSERYEFLSAQVQDVETSRNDLLKLIDELTVQMRDIFIERFQQINRHYGEVFAELFGGGKGELLLTDPQDVLHSGIEMRAQPPGKKILNLESLSGGEKALSAIALLFAILKVTPSPFCVLDEIEAALDDVNVDRYAAYLRRMCDQSQFIVITHRRGTMEEADVLYGVTMQEQGVSKLLELRASEVEAKLGLSV